MTKPLEPWLAGSMGAATARRGTDVTASSARRACLVLAPHPDDETLACGATVMRRVSASTPVHVVVVSDGRTWPPRRAPEVNVATRDTELRAACGLLGLGHGDVTHLAFREQELADAGAELVDAVADAVRRTRPVDVLATSEFDPHPDHAALGMAARRAVAGSGARLLAYPVWQWESPRSWTRTARGSGASAELVRTDGYLERKRAAIAVYRSQLTVQAGGELTDGYGMGPRFLRHFLGRHEMFFPVRVEP
jgi:LmbE family N-acetylglucosaminyl deacetylase